MQKKRFIALLKRDAKWGVDYNGRSTDFLPSLMMEQGCFKFGCSYCYTERNYPNNFLKIYSDLFNVVSLAQYIEHNQEDLEAKFIEINKKPFEKNRDPRHPKMITMDLGCDSDVVTSNSVTYHSGYAGHMVDAMNQIAEATNQIMTPRIRPITLIWKCGAGTTIIFHSELRSHFLGLPLPGLNSRIDMAII